MLIGYARVSTTGQNLDSQRDQLRQAGCEKTFEEKLTGADRKRPQLTRMLREIETGDTLVITSLDRLARSTHDLFEITKTLEERGINFRSLREPWADTTSSMGKFLLTVFAGLSELERSLIRDRTEDGRIAAKKRGVQFGRKPKLTSHQQAEVVRMLDEGMGIREISRHFNVGVATIDRVKNNALATCD
jgi:DNA invertase Pin-like site-specific DNA recombinase